MGRTDFVIVGAGIAGSALAHALAKAGRKVLVLEHDLEYRDKVRGENMPPWGVAELKALGLDATLLAAGGHYVQRIAPYDSVFTTAEAEERTLDIRTFLPDAAGFLDVGHPQACAALSGAAAQAGASVVYGVSDVRVQAGERPQVSFSHDGVARTLECGLIIGADGRQSSVRKQLGFTLVETEARTVAAGLLVEGLRGWPLDVMCAGSDRDRYHLVFPRANGVARLYLLWSIADRTRYAGAGGARAFLDDFRVESLPWGDAVADSTPAGPCATYPMNDSYIDEPMIPGAVLIGDAAGWNDPIIGQGLSIALRDARSVRDILLASDAPPSVDALIPYAQERKERMRRLRFSARVITDVRCTFTPESLVRRRKWYDSVREDPLVLASGLGPVVGPELMPAEGFTEAALAHVLAL